MNLGTNYNGAGQVVVQCLSTACTNQVVLDFETYADWVLTAIDPTRVIHEGMATTLEATFLKNGLPAGDTVEFHDSAGTLVGTSTAGPSGTVDAFVQPLGATTHVYTGETLCNLGTADGCGALLPVQWYVTVEATGVEPASPLTFDVETGETVSMEVFYGSASFPGDDGTDIRWTDPVTSVIVETDTGLSAYDYIPATPGVHQVTAEVVTGFGCTNTNCTLGTQETFTITAVERAIAVFSGQNQASTPNTPFPLELEVGVSDDDGTGATPAANVQVEWIVVNGTASPAISVSDGGGVARTVVTPTAVGPVQVTARRLDSAKPGVAFANLQADPIPAVVTFVSGPLTLQQGTQGQYVVEVADATGVPMTSFPVTWAVSPATGLNLLNPTGTDTDGTGRSTAIFDGVDVDQYLVEASVDPDGIPNNGDEGTASFTVDVVPVPLFDHEQGDGQTTIVGVPFADDLMVYAYDSAGDPTANLQIDWELVTGNATFPASSQTSVDGFASIAVTPTQTGTLQILARRSDEPNLTVLFTLQVDPRPVTMTAVSPNPNPGFVGVQQLYRVYVEEGGVARPATTVTWTAATPDITVLSPTSQTNGAGEAEVAVVPNTPGLLAGVLTASVDPDGVPASGDEASYIFDANILGAPVLTKEAGDNGQALPGDDFPELQVRTQTGTSNFSANITWTVLSGDATLSTPAVVTSNPTDGLARATITAGTNAGPVQVAATWTDVGLQVVFDLEVRANATTMNAVSDDPANLLVGVPRMFTIHLEQKGLPAALVPVTWTAVPGITVTGGASVTLASGNASMQIRGDIAGDYPDGVIASVDPDGRPGSGDESEHRFHVIVDVQRELTVVSGQNQTGIVGVALASPLVVNADDSGTPAVGLAIDWQVSPAGAATVNPGGPTDGLGNAQASVVPGAPGTLTIVASRSDDPSVQVVFTADIVAAGTSLSAVTPNPVTIGDGVATVFTVEATQGGAPLAGVVVDWSSVAGLTIGGGTSLTGADGRASATVAGTAPGSYPGGVTAAIDPDGIPASGDESSVAFTVDVSSAPTLRINGGQGQTGTVGQTLAQVLSVVAEDSGVPAASEPISWQVVTGTATLNASGDTDGNGEAHVSVIPTSPGPLVITAERLLHPGVMVTFNLNATAEATITRALTPNPAQLEVGVPTTFSVQVEQGGAPLPGVTVTWNAAPGILIQKLDTTTDTDGESSVTVTATTVGNIANALQVEVDPDGIPASGDESSLTFSVTAATVPTLAIAGGDNQATVVGSAFAAPLEVLASDSGTPTAGLVIDWTSTGNVIVTAGGPTGSDGKASATVVAGSTPGTATVTASRSDDPSVSVTFQLTVSQFGTLTVTGGDEQVLQPNEPSAPLEVTLHDGGGLPVAGAVIQWSASSGTLASATSTTNAAGVATNTVTVSVAGAIEVTATSPIAAAPAVFSLNGALAGLPGLDPIQQQVAIAIDNACPALAALAAPSAEQADLLARCRELLDSAGVDPDAVVGALDELMTPLALAQGQASLAAVQAQFQNLKARIAALRSGTMGTSFGGLALNTRSGPLSLEALSSAFSQAEDPAAGGEIGSDFSRWGFFASGNIGRGEFDEGSLDPAFDFDIEGLTFGLDYRYSDSWIFGAALGYTRQDTELADNRGSVDTTGWSVSAYTTYYKSDSWYVDGVLTFGQNDFGLVRRIDYSLPLPGGGMSSISQVAKSDSSGDLLSAAFTFGRDFNRGAFGIGPYGRLLYTRLDFDAIDEQLAPGAGSGLGLHIDERTITSLASTVGAKLTYTHSAEWGVLIPHFQLEWEHEFRDDPQALQARFLHDPTATPIIVSGDARDSDYFRIGVGLSLVLTKGRSGFLYYEQLLGRNGESQYNVALGLRMEF
ncbi:autotransporter outer membrane beta-barrel domain-containing protein [Arenimonas composti]|uniref:autotransporter outer membrane beta-barrel domain-containing protein n=1 Tax=Arenimonas composti TaxID=370776 RepID=UPI0012B64FDF|nr:autotransporter outer membrane beta-barrel domain-containing protein [Arenimonas composti]